MPKVAQHNSKAGLTGHSSPGTIGWSKGVVKEKEGESLPLPGKERFLMFNDHVIGL